MVRGKNSKRPPPHFPVWHPVSHKISTTLAPYALPDSRDSRRKQDTYPDCYQMSTMSIYHGTTTVSNTSGDGDACDTRSRHVLFLAVECQREDGRLLD